MQRDTDVSVAVADERELQYRCSIKNPIDAERHFSKLVDDKLKLKLSKYKSNEHVTDNSDIVVSKNLKAAHSALHKGLNSSRDTKLKRISEKG
jgi:hypothetical protein